MELNRRAFIKAAGIAGIAAATVASPVLADEVSALPLVPQTWDRETDVVVVGSGSIISAALRAHDEGLDVLVLEKHPTWFGGTTALCGGGMTCPNSSMALAQGCPEVPRELIRNYMLDVSDGHSSEELIDMMLDNYAPAVDYLNEECSYKWTHYGRVPGMTFNIYYPNKELEENYSDVPFWVTIGQYEPTGATMGRALAAYGKDAIAARGIEVLLGTPAVKLIYRLDDRGNKEVLGVWAQTPEGTHIAIKARYAVVLGTGGFDQNREMVKHYISHPIYSTCAIDTNTGDGHIMAMEIGANMRNMTEGYFNAYNMFGNPDNYASTDMSRENGEMFSEETNGRWNAGACGSIIVNKLGQRFVCEDASYDLFGRSFEEYDTGRNEWRNLPAFVVMDGTYKGTLGSGTQPLASYIESGEFPAWLNVFDSLEDLADGMGIDKQGLLETVERWNGFCTEGVDHDYNRGVNTWGVFMQGDEARVESGELKNPCLAPLTDGPFYCVPVYPGMLQTAGGIEINGSAQVKDVRGEVISRLYAGSCCIANTMGRAYPFGGTTLANGYVVGYVAANHIATLQSWE